MKKSLVFNILFFVLGSIIFLFILLPIVKLLSNATPKLILDAIRDKEIVNSIILTLKISLFSTLFALITGVPLAYMLARWKLPFKPFIEAIIDIPVMIPHTAAGIALLVVFGSHFFLGKFFSIFGIHFVGTELGIAIGMMYVSISYLIHNAKLGFQKIDLHLEQAARTMGASPVQVFKEISLPLAKKDIISGSIMMWARGISEFGAIIILTYHPMVATTLILDRYRSFGLKYSLPISVLLVLISIVIFLIMRWINNRK